MLSKRATTIAIATLAVVCSTAVIAEGIAPRPTLGGPPEIQGYTRGLKPRGVPERDHQPDGRSHDQCKDADASRCGRDVGR